MPKAFHDTDMVTHISRWRLLRRYGPRNDRSRVVIATGLPRGSRKSNLFFPGTGLNEIVLAPSNTTPHIQEVLGGRVRGPHTNARSKI